MPLLLGLAAVVGVLIGLVGVGGVLLPPGLMFVGGLTASEAAATSLWVFGFTGVVGTVAYARRGVVPWAMAGWLSAGIAPGAFLGARANALLPGPLLVAVMAAFTIGVGLHQLRRRRPSAEPGGATGESRRGSTLVALGGLVGFGSALTGTGGPVILVPLLLVLAVPPVRAVAVSQVAQLPVVVAGSVGYLDAGLTDVRLGTGLGLLAATGALVGAALATRVRAERLRAIVAAACIGAGLLLLARLVVG
ncbi:sulfite exporter TauE/SafE family protein [Nocardioides sp. HDW12B]|uniref:sulfite exporter TauE/SafE family protein n=1 Tax=Nocardioides sp. HDW12B TaxID=2714939 RepID=UPI00140E1D85|nr:sulfite exporter TauE/SafE family protein [Nocardioides sp. HDW12B]QIK68101.1 sulfite exporter TauE/SafE family protein [Nocardioides sp. HDW12B]